MVNWEPYSNDCWKLMIAVDFKILCAVFVPSFVLVTIYPYSNGPSYVDKCPEGSQGWYELTNSSDLHSVRLGFWIQNCYSLRFSGALISLSETRFKKIVSNCLLSDFGYQLPLLQLPNTLGKCFHSLAGTPLRDMCKALLSDNYGDQQLSRTFESEHRGI